MTNDQMDRDLAIAQQLTTLRVDRCRHETVDMTALWFFDATSKQVGSASRTDGEHWRVNRMQGGMPTSQLERVHISAAVLHICQRPRR